MATCPSPSRSCCAIGSGPKVANRVDTTAPRFRPPSTAKYHSGIPVSTKTRSPRATPSDVSPDVNRLAVRRASCRRGHAPRSTHSNSAAPFGRPLVRQRAGSRPRTNVEACTSGQPLRLGFASARIRLPRRSLHHARAGCHLRPWHRSRLVVSRSVVRSNCSWLVPNDRRRRVGWPITGDREGQTIEWTRKSYVGKGVLR
jgi:hypothetical protein